MDISLSKLPELVMDRETWRAAVHGSQRVGTTEQLNWTKGIKKYWCIYTMEYSVQFSHSVVSDSLRPHELQHVRPPCPSPTSGACSNSCPSSQWCHPTILSSVIHFFCLQSFPASESLPMSQFFTSGGQNIGVSASTSVLPKNTQDWSPLGWTGWISFQSKGLSSLLQHHSSKTLILQCSAFFIVQLTSMHD